MNTDTERAIKEIESNGYYRKGQTLGPGGWPYLYAKVGLTTWNTYKLNIDDQDYTADEIVAKDDETAIKAFHKLFHLDDCDYDILRVVNKVTVIESEYNRKNL